MVKQWSGFFGLALVAAAVASPSLSFVSQLHAEEPGPAPSLSPELLKLPELEPVRQPTNEQKAAGIPVVGDELPLQVTGISADAGAEFQKGFKIEDPSGEDHLMEAGWQGVELEGKGQGLGEVRFTLIPIKSGKIRLPPLIIKDAAGKAWVRTQSTEYEVGSAISPSDPKPGEMSDVRPPMSLPIPIWAIVGGGLLILVITSLIIYSLYRWAQKIKNRPVAKVVVPLLPEDEVALAQISELERKGLLRQGQFKPYSFGLSEILKEYLARRFEFDASESTAHEIISYLEKRKTVSDQAIDRLETVFEKLDRVKFSDHIPESDEAVWTLEEARKWIALTRRMPVAASLLPSGLPPGATNAS